MKIVIAVSERDLELAEAQSNLLLKQGGLSQHTCLLVTAPSIPSFDTKNIVNNLQKAFGSFEHLKLEGAVQEKGHSNPDVARIIAKNHMFQATVRHLDATGNSIEWYWFEPDCVPLTERWADEIARDYLMSSVSGRVFMGKTLFKAELQNKNGENVIKEYPDQPYMMKSGVYPPTLSRYSTLWSTARTIPWELSMQWETARTHTDLGKVAHNPNTVKYEKTGPGQLSCTVLGQYTRAKNTTNITPDQLVFHGCKDTTIIDMVLSGELFAEGTPVRTVGSVIDKLTPATTPTPTEVVADRTATPTFTAPDVKVAVERLQSAIEAGNADLEAKVTKKVDTSAFDAAEAEFLKSIGVETPVVAKVETLVAEPEPAAAPTPTPTAKKKAKPAPTGGLSIENSTK